MNWVGLFFGTSTGLLILIILLLVGAVVLYTKRECVDPGSRKCLNWYSIFVGIIVLLYIIPVSLTITYMDKVSTNINKQ